MPHPNDLNEQETQSRFDERVAEVAPNFAQKLTIVVVGKVSSGKSSLLNALLQCPKEEPIFRTDALAGVTVKPQQFHFDEHVLLVDLPGLRDNNPENARVTEDFLAKKPDVGIFVVTGAADSSQREDYEKLRSSCGKVFFVLNKIDEWERHGEAKRNAIIAQWREQLGVERVYPTCAFGYDEHLVGIPLDLRGISELRDDIWAFLEKSGKAALLARIMRDKSWAAKKVILGVLPLVAAEAVIPGSAAYISATQVAAIIRLHYIYKGVKISPKDAVALLPVVAAETLGSTAFLWAKSLLPPTVVVDAAAAAIASTITLALLAAVAQVLASGAELTQKDALRASFSSLKAKVGERAKTALATGDWQSLVDDVT